MQQNNTPPPPQGQISVQDIASLYIAMANISNRSENLSTILNNLEQVLLSFSNSLGYIGAKQ